ncbi:hypothetical protein PV327_003148 [Microctonus hyperodae]|uniref:Uncharacterized protein n=1 Tax=Microctonus hyperodae TaxID=165561 RepID=A0AA39L0L4_MICHY|nr:hypothetical protein PV327_003148 [Microctonus hyperodae]
MAAQLPLSSSSSRNSINNSMHKNEYLFLLEFFVHSITGERLAKLNQMFPLPTSIFLHFFNMNNNDVEVKPVDQKFLQSSGDSSIKNTEHFYSGRSVLFALPYRIVVDKNTELKISITICKIMPVGQKPDITVATGELDMTEQFAGLRKEMFNCWHHDIPPPKCFEGDVQLNYQNEPAAVALIFARISAFGQSIITEFESPCYNSTSSSFIFKGDEKYDKTVAYKCQIVRQGQMNISKDSLVSNRLIKKSSIFSHNNVHLNQITSDKNIITQKNQGDYEISKSKVTVKSIENKDKIVQSHRDKLDKPCGNPVVLKVSGLLMDENGNVNKPTVTVGDESDKTDDHDVFILRIGKKGIVGEGEKSDIQLEMRTPKGPIKRPPIRYETREIQTDVEEKLDKVVGEIRYEMAGQKKLFRKCT